MKKKIRWLTIICFVFTIIFVSCKSAEENRLVEIGNSIVAWSFSDLTNDSLLALSSGFKPDPKIFADVDGLSPEIFSRIKKNGTKGAMVISAGHKFSANGLRLYILTFKGPAKNQSTAFNMTITFTYSGGRFQVQNADGGLGAG